MAIDSRRSKKMTAKEADDLSKTSLRELLAAADRTARLTPAVTESHEVLVGASFKADEQDD